MVNRTEGKIVLSRIDTCGIFGKRVGSNAVCCAQCTKRIGLLYMGDARK